MDLIAGSTGGFGPGFPAGSSVKVLPRLTIANKRAASATDSLAQSLNIFRIHCGKGDEVLVGNLIVAR